MFGFNLVATKNVGVELESDWIDTDQAVQAIDELYKGCVPEKEVEPIIDIAGQAMVRRCNSIKDQTLKNMEGVKGI